MKSVIKLMLVVSLFASAVFAEGELPNGNRNCPNGQTTCFVADEPTGDETKSTDSEDTLLVIVQNYFDSVFGYFVNED